MAAKIRLADGREITVALSGKRTADALQATIQDAKLFTQFNTAAKSKVWIAPAQVAAIEDRGEND
jgi:hypothetical protein